MLKCIVYTSCRHLFFPLADNPIIPQTCYIGVQEDRKKKTQRTYKVTSLVGSATESTFIQYTYDERICSSHHLRPFLPSLPKLLPLYPYSTLLYSTHTPTPLAHAQVQEAFESALSSSPLPSCTPSATGCLTASTTCTGHMPLCCPRTLPGTQTAGRPGVGTRR